jgi:molybdate transport system ATP-binding protein
MSHESGGSITVQNENARIFEMTAIWQFEAATITRVGVGPVIHDLTWSLAPGQTWAIVGPVASGKTTLADTLRGRLRVVSGSLRRPAGEPGQGVALVGFREESRRFSYARHYYQQRFNFIEPDEDLTLRQFLIGEQEELSESGQSLLRLLHLEGLLDRSLIQLSNGQMRRARLTRALLTQPELLILDEPFIGLDVAGRAEVAALLGDLVRSGQRLLLVTRADAIPEWVTHVLELTGGRCTWQGPRTEYQPPPSPEETASPARTQVGEPILELDDVHVRYGDSVILDGITWSVRLGERWAVLGPNGAGKTTLLSLLCGDHPQAYSNHITLFGRRRGTGETIWDIKRQVGLLSPELHLYFTEPLTAEQAAGTGFHDALVARPLTGAQRDRIQLLFGELAPEVPLDRPFARLSSGEQRLTLLVRALVKETPLLILDEPFQALDPATMVRARTWLDRHLGPTQTLLFVTHHPEELPASITHRLVLSQGQATSCGPYRIRSDWAVSS